MKEALWSKAARADLARIDDEFARIDPEFADRIGAAAIAKRPVLGTPYILTYRLRRGRVEIIRVHHNRENWRPR